MPVYKYAPIMYQRQQRQRKTVRQEVEEHIIRKKIVNYIKRYGKSPDVGDLFKHKRW